MPVFFMLASFCAFGQETPGKTSRFDHAEYLRPAPGENKKAAPVIQGTLEFNPSKKSAEFLDRKGASIFSVKYDAIKSLLYERTSRPRYVAAVLVSPLFLLARSKKHYLTIQYVDGDGTGQ